MIHGSLEGKTMQGNEQTSQHQSRFSGLELELLLLFLLSQILSILGEPVAKAAWRWSDNAALGLYIAISSVVLLLRLREKRKKVSWGYIPFALALFSVGIIIVLADRYQWPGTTIANCAIVACGVVFTFGAIRRWSSLPPDMRKAAKYRLHEWIERFKTMLRRLTAFFPGTLARKLVLLLVAVVILACLAGLLRDQISAGFGVCVSVASVIRQMAKAHEDTVVFTTLGLASFSVLLAVLIIIIYDRYRRLSAMFLAVAFLAMTMLFCTYTAQTIVDETRTLIGGIVAPSSTAAPTVTPTPTPAPIQVTDTLTPILTLTPTFTTEMPGKTPASTDTREPVTTTAVSPAPTWTPTPRTSPTPTPSPTTLVTPTRVQPPLPTSTPTRIPTPTRIQPPPPPATRIPTPTRIQPPKP